VNRDVEINIIFIINISNWSMEFFNGEYSLRFYIHNILRIYIKTKVKYEKTIHFYLG